MINKVIVTNHLGESITMELRFPEKSGFLVRNITGLDPSKADIEMSKILSGDGSLPNSARVNSRNVVFTLALLESPTIEAARHRTYRYFPLTKFITIRVETDTRICETIGQVESNSITIFNKTQVATISVLCPSAYLQDVEKEVTVFSGIAPAFEFPFSNESTTLKLLKFGDILNSTEKSVYYSGDAPTGLVMYIHALGTVTNLRISNTRTQELMVIDTDRLTALTGNPIIAGDDIIISTIKGNKSISLIRDGVSINILNCLDKYMDWFQLEKGDNLFRYLADSGTLNLLFRIESQILYEGV